MAIKTLGILGLGSQTTAFYIKELNRVFNENKGGYSTCPFLLFNINFDAINSLLPYISDDLDELVQACFSEIENTEIEHLITPNITLHETSDRLKYKNTILHPVDICISKIKENKWSQVVLLGSLHTIQSNYIRTKFSPNNIEILLPSEEDRLFIEKVRIAVYADTQTEELLNKYHLIIEKYAVNMPVILTCTELSIFKPINNNLLDMAQLQIEEAVKTVLKYQ